MKKHKFTYEKSGVSINAADNFVKFLSTISTKNKGNKKFKNIGNFSSISNIPKNINQPKIVASTDGVGTKIEIANLLKKYKLARKDLIGQKLPETLQGYDLNKKAKRIRTSQEK